MAPRSWHGFDEGLSAWGKSLLQTPKLLANRAFYIRDPAEQIADKAAAGRFDNDMCATSAAQTIIMIMRGFTHPSIRMQVFK